MRWFKLFLGLALIAVGIWMAGHNLRLVDPWVVSRLYVGTMAVLLGAKYVYAPNAGLDSSLHFKEGESFSHWVGLLVIGYVLPGICIYFTWWTCQWAFTHLVPWYVGFLGTVAIAALAAVIVFLGWLTLCFFGAGDLTGKN